MIIVQLYRLIDLRHYWIPTALMLSTEAALYWIITSPLVTCRHWTIIPNHECVNVDRGNVSRQHRHGSRHRRQVRGHCSWQHCLALLSVAVVSVLCQVRSGNKSSSIFTPMYTSIFTIFREGASYKYHCCFYPGEAASSRPGRPSRCMSPLMGTSPAIVSCLAKSKLITNAWKYTPRFRQLLVVSVKIGNFKCLDTRKIGSGPSHGSADYVSQHYTSPAQSPAQPSPAQPSPAHSPAQPSPAHSPAQPTKVFWK